MTRLIIHYCRMLINIFILNIIDFIKLLNDNNSQINSSFSSCSKSTLSGITSSIPTISSPHSMINTNSSTTCKHSWPIHHYLGKNSIESTISSSQKPHSLFCNSATPLISSGIGSKTLKLMLMKDRIR